MLHVTSKGNFHSTINSLNRMLKIDYQTILKTAGRDGVNALRLHTPIDTGLAADSWSYRVYKNRRGMGVVWMNSDVEDGFPVVIRLHYGYVTGTGGYVEGTGFITKALRPIFDSISDRLIREVNNA